MAGRVVIGTSSWAAPGFVEEWYPDDLLARAPLTAPVALELRNRVWLHEERAPSTSPSRRRSYT